MRLSPALYSRLLKYATAGAAFSDWYVVARSTIEAHSAKCGYDPGVFIDVLAITSPRIHIKQNWWITDHYMNYGVTPRKLLPSVQTALDTYHATGRINGLKTSAFAGALRGDTMACVIDVWMCRALGVPHAQVGRKTNYLKASGILERSAIRAGTTPAELQASIWAGIMQEHGKIPSYFHNQAEVYP